MIVQLGSGDPRGHLLRVGSDGSAQTSVTNTVTTTGTVTNTVSTNANVTNTVETVQAGLSMKQATVSIPSTGNTELVGSEPNRRHLTLQNLDASNAVHIDFDNGTPTTDDFRLDPGAIFSLPDTNGASVRAIAAAGTVKVVYIELYGT